MAKTKTKHSTTTAAAQDLQKIGCALISALTGVAWGSSQDDDAEIKPRQSGQSGIDVVISRRVRNLLIKSKIPDCIECKNTKQWNLQSAIRQAKANTPKGSRWMLILKRRSRLAAERIEPIVVMDLKDFQDLIFWLLPDLLSSLLEKEK